MKSFRLGGEVRRAIFAAFLLGFAFARATSAQETVGITEVTPNVLVFSTKTGNVIASVGPDGALLIGTPAADSTERISGELAKRTKSPVRYVVIMPEDAAHSEGDAGWGRRGAFVAMHENALKRLGGNSMGAQEPLSRRLAELGVDRPTIAFSEVLAFDLNGDAIHVVHMKPGYSDADALVHFHNAKVIYFGEAFPGDGYPTIDAAQGGTLEGLVKTLDGWSDPGFHVVPARGEVTNGRGLKAFCDMLKAVRDRVKRSIEAGHTETEGIGEYPTAEFDAKWGHGRVSSHALVQEMYRELTKKAEK